MYMEPAKNDAGAPAPQGNFVLVRMIRGRGKERKKVLLSLDKDLMRIAEDHNISPERGNLSDEVNLILFAVFKARGWLG